MSRKTLTAALTCYNHATCVGAALKALIHQSRPADQIVIVDDGSTDDSNDVIRSIADGHSNIIVHRHETNQGARDARRQAVSMATGDFLYNAASDDQVLPGLFDMNMRMLEAHPEAAACTAQSLVMDPSGKLTGLLPVPIVATEPTYLAPDDVKARLCRYGAWFLGNTAIYRRSVFSDPGALNINLGPFVDGFLMHVIALRHGICYVPEPLAVWRQVESGLAISTSRDVSRMREIVKSATDLMRSSNDFEGLFPEKYVRDWERRQSYWMTAANARDLHAKEIEFLDAFKGIPQRLGVVDRIFATLLRFGMSLRHSMTMAYALLRTATWPASVLMLNWYLRNLRFKFCGKARYTSMMNDVDA
jgi:glycosyltransferase involved in cell wall biosynthesis